MWALTSYYLRVGSPNGAAPKEGRGGGYGAPGKKWQKDRIERHKYVISSFREARGWLKARNLGTLDIIQY